MLGRLLSKAAFHFSRSARYNRPEQGHISRTRQNLYNEQLVNYGRFAHVAAKRPPETLGIGRPFFCFLTVLTGFNGRIWINHGGIPIET